MFHTHSTGLALICLQKILIPSEINDTLKIPLVEFKDIFTDYIAFMEDIIAEQNISITKNVKLKQVEYPVVIIIIRATRQK